MTDVRRAAVGAFVLGGTVLVLGAVVLFGRFSLFHPPLHAEVVFEDSISGLSVGSPVTFRGVRVGALDGIALRFDPATHAATIPVTVQLDAGSVRIVPAGGAAAPDLAQLITRGLRAEPNTQSFVTGQS